MSTLPARRPLKSRSAAWAQSLARMLLKWGVRPNQVSVASVGSAMIAGAAMLAATYGSHGPAWLWWILAAVGVQGRLVCNLMDGMLAMEGGLKSATGDVFNEFPDRLADTAILVSLGYAGGCATVIAMGWAAACLALMTASVRLLGASLTAHHDYRGPMAKPQRMAAVTGCAVLCSAAVLTRQGTWIPALIGVSLAVITAGAAWTCARRLRSLCATLSSK